MAVSHINKSPSTQTQVLNQQFIESFKDIEWLRNSISLFENTYGMSSDEMLAKVPSAEIEETDDICSWLIKADWLHNVEPIDTV
jgi:hypothetical protein